MTNATHLTENYTASLGRVLWYSHLKLCNSENTVCQQCTYQKMNAFPCMSYSSDCNKNEMKCTLTWQEGAGVTCGQMTLWRLKVGTCWGALQYIHVPLILSQYMPVWAMQFLMFVFQ